MLIQAFDFVTLYAVPLTRPRKNYEWRPLKYGWANLFAASVMGGLIVFNILFENEWWKIVLHAGLAWLNLLLALRMKTLDFNGHFLWMMYSGERVRLDDSQGIRAEKLLDMYVWLNKNVGYGNWAQRSTFATDTNFKKFDWEQLAYLNATGNFPMDFVFRRKTNAMMFKLTWGGDVTV